MLIKMRHTLFTEGSLSANLAPIWVWMKCTSLSFSVYSTFWPNISEICNFILHVKKKKKPKMNGINRSKLLQRHLTYDYLILNLSIWSIFSNILLFTIICSNSYLHLMLEIDILSISEISYCPYSFSCMIENPRMLTVAPGSPPFVGKTND